MGFLNNTTVTVDAILTKKGRELLAQGTEAFNITKFALADDEVDYNLWDVTHPNGSDYYGKVIENMPLLEAFPDENHVMRYKLVTLPKTTTRMPVLTIDGESTLSFPNLQPPSNRTISVNTSNAVDSSYTFIIHDNTIVNFAANSNSSAGASGTVPFFLGKDDAPNSETRVGTEATIRNVKLTSAKSTQLTIVGNDTGATKSVTITNNFVNNPAN